MTNEFKEDTSKTELKDKVRTSKSPYYFSKDTIRFFGSKIEGSPKKNEKGDIIFQEKLTNAPSGTDYKVGVYDSKENELYTSELLSNKSSQNEIYSQVQKGDRSKLS